MPESTIYPVYLGIKSPLILGGGAITRETVERAKRDGCDGIIKGGPYPELVAFRPEQIKSAIGNNGEFSPDRPEMTKSMPLVLLFKGGKPGAPGLYRGEACRARNG